MTKQKISIIAAGNTRSTLAFIIAKHELADVVLIDQPKNEGQVKGKALDILQSSPIYGFDVNVSGSVDYSDTKNSDIVVITDRK
ncbi:malate dehydrogenase, partial [Mesorhizobium sp. M8A.F.Ca.ET.173.01.1.1]